MIDFELEPELALLQETARSFAQAQLRPHEREHETARCVQPDVRKRWIETGLAGVEHPEHLGGADLGPLARCLVLEELAAADVGAGLALDTLGPALYALRECGGSDALEEFGRPVLETPEGRALLATDPGGAVHVHADRAEGELAWLPADRVDLLVVLRADDALVIREGFELEPVRGSGLRAAGASALRMSGARVAAHFADAHAVRRARARARLYGAALLVGVMRVSAEASRDYALQRTAFGRPIAHHQALAFLIADMASAVEGSRLLVHEAATRLEHADAAEACASAFLEAAEQALFVTHNGVQILGGHGFMQDYPLEKYMREARALGLLFGGMDAAREEAGAELAASASPLALTLSET
jgi:alkylation response protein AidB-like acyl-CoA dehydrogenase